MLGIWDNIDRNFLGYRQAAAGLCAALQAGRQDSADSGATVRAVWEALSAVATGSGTPFSPRSAAARVLPGSADGRERHIRAIRLVQRPWRRRRFQTFCITSALPGRARK